MSMIEIEYRAVTNCPSCDASGAAVVDRLARRKYTFGPVEIALPPGGVGLLRCPTCDLVFKDRIPTPAALTEVMSAAATQVWKPARDAHPHAARIGSLLAGRCDGLIDIGAANGEVLAAARDATPRRSAFDIVAYPDCAARVSGEYVLGQFEQSLEWSGEPYGLVTAFDVFEHFSDAGAALDNLLAFVAANGALLLETGDSDRAFPSLGRWYYTAMFEHTIFWNRRSLDHAIAARGFRIGRFDQVNHKGRLRLAGHKKAAIWLAHMGGRNRLGALVGRRLTGVDIALIAHPTRHDHMLVELVRA